jgi:hypothetical protein
MDKQRYRTLRPLPLFCGVIVLLALANGCGHRNRGAAVASIALTRVPPADPGGPQKMDYIEGRATATMPGQQVVLYAQSGVWWVQPFANTPFTRIQADSTWENTTHLGIEYAALLVNPGYNPPARLMSIPPVGGGVAAVAVSTPAPGKPLVASTIQFSGYGWTVRTAGSDRGGAPRFYDSDNAWTDAKGFLHLRMEQRDGEWHCAEVALNRSLGYGTYRFVVNDVSHIGDAAVVELFTFSDDSLDENRNEIDVDLSRWGNPDRENSQFVIQPYFVAQNEYRFNAPPGKLTYSFRWQSDSAKFMATRGEGAATVSEHMFTSGIPRDTGQTAHIDLFDYHYSKNSVHQPAEVVIEKFEFLP